MGLGLNIWLTLGRVAVHPSGLRADTTKDSRYFGTFVVQLPIGVASHRALADDMARESVEEVYANLLRDIVKSCVLETGAPLVKMTG